VKNSRYAGQESKIRHSTSCYACRAQLEGRAFRSESSIPIPPYGSRSAGSQTYGLELGSASVAGSRSLHFDPYRSPPTGGISSIAAAENKDEGVILRQSRCFLFCSNYIFRYSYLVSALPQSRVHILEFQCTAPSWYCELK